MAATVSAWGTKPGAWALDAEEHEEELQQERKAMEEKSKYSAASAVATADFPSLSAAVATKGKKKKPQTLSLAEFGNYSAVKVNRLTNEDLGKLPTGPRERSEEEMMEGGRGFRSYGMGRSEGGGDRWGGNRGEGDVRREPREPMGPSRADEIDNWAIGKKTIGGVGGGFERRERSGGSFFGSDSKADESDSWVSKKSFAPSDGPARRFVGSSGFERERRSYEPFTGNVGGADADNWGRKREERVVNGSENGQVGSGSRPKLNLQRRTLPVSVERPQSPNVDVAVVKPDSPGVVVKPRSFNPFGEARPREEVLAEKGQDWKKIDEQLESLKIKEIGGTGVHGSDRPGSAKKGFDRRGSLVEEKNERSWRKPESVDDARPMSAGKPADNGNPEEK